MRKKDLSTSVPNFIGIFVLSIQIWWHIRSWRIKSVRVQEQPAIKMQPLELDEWQPPKMMMEAKLVSTDYINDMKRWTPARFANDSPCNIPTLYILKSWKPNIVQTKLEYA